MSSYSQPRRTTHEGRLQSYPCREQASASGAARNGVHTTHQNPHDRNHLWELEESEQRAAIVLTNMLKDHAIINSKLSAQVVSGATDNVDDSRRSFSHSDYGSNYTGTTEEYTNSDSSDTESLATAFHASTETVVDRRGRIPVYRTPSVTPSNAAIYFDGEDSIGTQGRPSYYESSLEDEEWYLNKWMEQDQKVGSASDTSRRNVVRPQTGLIPPGLLESYAIYRDNTVSNTTRGRRS